MIERIFRAFFLLRPDHGFVRIGEPHAAEIWHGIVFDPYNIIQNPKSQVLHDRADTINIVIRPDDPDRAGVFQDALSWRVATWM